MCFRFKKRSNIQQTKERLRQLTAVSELATTEYTIAKVVKAEDTPSLLRGQLGDRKLLYSCKIYVKAGIDLEGYDPAKTEIDYINKSIIVVLPHAKILSFNMPAEEWKLEYEKVGTLRTDFKQREKHEMLSQGEKSVRNEIANMGIFSDAERNATNIFTATLLQLDKYPHDYPNHYVEQTYLPSDLAGKEYYSFGYNKTEQAAKAYYDMIRKKKT